jgi:hypothetical protein
LPGITVEVGNLDSGGCVEKRKVSKLGRNGRIFILWDSSKPSGLIFASSPRARVMCARVLSQALTQRAAPRGGGEMAAVRWSQAACDKFAAELRGILESHGNDDALPALLIAHIEETLFLFGVPVPVPTIRRHFEAVLDYIGEGKDQTFRTLAGPMTRREVLAALLAMWVRDLVNEPPQIHAAKPRLT